MMPFQKLDGVMVDLETLSTRSNAAIVSIGACTFSWETGEITDKFKVNVSAESCKALGCHIDKEVVLWWGAQPRAARLAWMNDAVDVAEAVKQFSDWWGKDKKMFWANGLSFDAPILSNAFLLTKIERPWHYRYEMDLRTTFSLVGHNLAKERRNSEEHQYHDALEDAIAQTKTLLELFK